MTRLFFFFIGLVFAFLLLDPFIVTIVAWKSEISLAMISSGMLAPISITAIFSTVAFTAYMSIRSLLHS